MASPDEGMRQIHADVLAWQIEALTLPLAEVKGTAVTRLNDLALALNGFNQAQTSAEMENALVKVIIAAVAASVYTLGASQRGPHGFRIITPPSRANALN